MDIKRISGLENLSTPPTKGIDSFKGPSFKETLEKTLDSTMSGAETQAVLGKAQVEGVKFSNHAIERMRSRGISFSPQDISKLGQAVEKAAAKGAKDSLILMNDSALIVSVKNNTVVTVMDKAALKENVFTNIDSTIVM